MWWPFGRKQEEEKSQQDGWRLVLPDDPDVTIENYRTPFPWFINIKTGEEIYDYCLEVESFPPDMPWIRESEAEKILQRFATSPQQSPQSSEQAHGS